MENTAQTFNVDPIPWNLGNQMFGAGTNDATIMEMRWESQNLKIELWQKLAGRVPVEKDGQIYLDRENPTIPPPMNDLGANRIIQLVTGFVNPVVALSNISDEEANTMANFALRAAIVAVGENQQEWEINSLADMDLIIATITPIVFCQIKRPVNGHESNKAKTQIMQSTGDQTITNKSGGGFSLNPFSKR